MSPVLIGRTECDVWQLKNEFYESIREHRPVNPELLDNEIDGTSDSLWISSVYVANPIVNTKHINIEEMVNEIS